MNKPQVERTSGSALVPSSFSTTGVNDERVRAAYAALTDRERLVGKCLNSARSARELPPYDDIDLLVRIRDWSKPLREVPGYALPECFTRAVAGHNPAHPFQVSEIVLVWRCLPESERQKLFDESHIAALPSGPRCAWCAGRGLMRVADDGSAVLWESSANTRRMKVCFCKTGAAIPQPDPEPVVEGEPFDLKRAARMLIEERKIAKVQSVEDVKREARLRLLRQQAEEIANEEASFPTGEAESSDAVVRLN